MFSREDLQCLAGMLDGLKGKFILSLRDKPSVRETFSNFKFEAVKTRYSVSAKGRDEVGDVLISNFKLQTKRLN